MKKIIKKLKYLKYLILKKFKKNQLKNQLVKFSKFCPDDVKTFNSAVYNCVLREIVQVDKNKKNWHFRFEGIHSNKLIIKVPYFKLPALDYKQNNVYTISVTIKEIQTNDKQ